MSNTLGQTASFDLTGRQATEQALRESEEKFRAIFMQAMVGIACVGLDGRFLQVNPALCELFGYSEAELLERDFQSITHPEDLQSSVGIKQEALAGGRFPHQLQKRYIRKTGEVIWTILNVSVVRDQNGQPLYLIGHVHDITARRQAEENLRQSETLRRERERLQIILDASPLAMAITRVADGKVLFANELLGALFGVASEELLQQKATDFYQNPADRATMLAVLQKRGHLSNYEIQAKKKNGTPVWVLISAQSLLYENVPALMTGFIDLTERKQAEEEIRRLNAELEQRVLARTQTLQENEEKFRSLAQSTSAAIFIFQGPQMRYVNASAERISGYSAAELTQMNFWEILHPDFQSEAKARGLARQRGEFAPPRYEVKVLTKNREERWMDFTAVNIVLEGQPAVLGTAVDITEHKRAEEKLHQNTSHLQAVLTALPDIYFRLSGEGVIEDCHAPDESELYLPREQFLGKHVTEVLPLPVGERLQHAIAETLQNNRLVTLEYSLPLPQGEQFFEARFSSVFGKEAIALARNITQRKRLEEQLQQYADNLERLVEARAQRIYELEKQQVESEKLATAGRMAARIAHEINNPLAGIQGAFQLIKDAIPSTHQHYKFVARIENEIEHIARIIRQMFDLYSPEKEAVRRFQLDLAIQDILALLQVSSRERQVTIVSDTQQATLEVAWPESLIRQVLYNLLQNAIEASPEGGVVKLTVAAEPERITITVADHGPGISAEIRSRIFEPFFTTKSGFSKSGLGLGLSVCKSIVEAMGGTIDLTSNSGEGAVFRIIVPLAK